MKDQKTTFEGYSYRTSARFGSRVQVSVEDGTASVTGPRVGVLAYRLWIGHTGGPFLANRTGAHCGGSARLAVRFSRIGAAGRSLGHWWGRCGVPMGVGQSHRFHGWRAGRIAAGVLALASSLLVIAVYHLGYPEFRGPQVILVVVGVGIQSLLTLLTGSPIVVVLGHIAMHITAVLYGLNSVSQLPPHY